MGGSGYSPRITEVLFKVKSFINIFDSMGVRIVNQSYPQKKYFGPPIGGVRGVGGSSAQPPYTYFLKGVRNL